jgi:hypothetical protein
LTASQRQEQCQKELDVAHANLFSCSAIDKPDEWQTLLKIVTTIAIQLDEISGELKRIERKFFLCLNNFHLFLFADILVNVLDGRDVPK